MIRTAADVRRTADALGNHFFEPITMRFFNSRLLNIFRALDETGTHGLFVTSERFDTDPRDYRVRVYRFVAGRFDVDTLGRFPTRAQAKRFVRDYAPPCLYVFDGLDTDGTPYWDCQTHPGTAMPSPDAPCSEAPAGVGSVGAWSGERTRAAIARAALAASNN